MTNCWVTVKQKLVTPTKLRPISLPIEEFVKVEQTCDSNHFL